MFEQFFNDIKAGKAICSCCSAPIDPDRCMPFMDMHEEETIFGVSCLDCLPADLEMIDMSEETMNLVLADIEKMTQEQSM